MRTGFSRRLIAALGVATSVLWSGAPGAGAAVPHTVQPGETLWSIAASQNFTTRTVAAYNGLPETATVVAGEVIQIPTVAEGAAALAASVPAPAADPAADAAAAAAGTHIVGPGETFSGIAATRGVSLTDLATVNGRGTDSFAYAGEVLTIPAAASAPAPTPAVSPTAGLGHVPSPYGELHLDPAAAESWNRMREESLRLYGQDLHPGGPLSAHRTYEQQQQLYELYLSGAGAPASPPGGSAHERGTAVDLETPEMRWVVDQIGAAYGWGKIEAPSEWWHVNYAP